MSSDILASSASVLTQNADHLCGIIYMYNETQETTSTSSGSNDLSSIKTLYDRAARRSMPFLLPMPNSDLKFILMQQSQGQREMKNQQTQSMTDEDPYNPKSVLSYICRIKGDRDYIVSTSQLLGEICVWDINSQTVVRRLTGLQAPRNVRMIDNTSAVVLCERELKIYNLDQGVLISSLKGMLNLKMSYYDIHDSNHVVALSRNRMCVNMINNSSGDLVTTFKSGENRFLDSMIVSANGERCVCRDEVEKPTPMLVWDLINQKLVHDLRLPGHTFISEISAISKDGNFMVVGCEVRSLIISVSYVRIYYLIRIRIFYFGKNYMVITNSNL